jgi:hypothetical protein
MPERYLLRPFRFGAQEQGPAGKQYNGLAVTEDADRHLRDKILAVLFTAPGERVNNPRFGVGLNRAVFEGLNELTLGALEFRIAQGLRRDLGDELIVETIDLAPDPPSGTLLLTIAYRRRSDRLRRRLQVEL